MVILRESPWSLASGLAKERMFQLDEMWEFRLIRTSVSAYLCGLEWSYVRG